MNKRDLDWLHSEPTDYERLEVIAYDCETMCKEIRATLPKNVNPYFLKLLGEIEKTINDARATARELRQREKPTKN